MNIIHGLLNPISSKNKQNSLSKTTKVNDYEDLNLVSIKKPVLHIENHKTPEVIKRGKKHSYGFRTRNASIHNSLKLS